MFARLPHSSAPRLLAALAVMLTLAMTLGLAGSAAKPANADASQWTRPHANWGSSNGWNRQWRTQTHRNQFHNRAQVIIGGGSGIIVAGPGFVVGSPGIIVRQPGFVVGQPGFVVRKPNFILERPSFAKKQWQFIKRHPSLRVGQPWRHHNWSHKRWKHKRWKHQMGGIN